MHLRINGDQCGRCGDRPKVPQLKGQLRDGYPAIKGLTFFLFSYLPPHG
jgi:hypothetical protein